MTPDKKNGQSETAQTREQDPKLSRTVRNLKRILAVIAKINSTLNLDELLGIIMTTASEVMETEAASLMLLDEASQELIFKVALGEKGDQLREKFRVKIGEGIAGHVAKTGEALIVNNAPHDNRFAGRFDAATGFTTRAIACVPMKNKGKVIGILQAINPVGRTDFSGEELQLFGTFADQAAISVEKARLHAEILKQEKAKQELKIAHDIQQNFLPDLPRGSFAIDIAAKNLPALEVGGDFYDVLDLDDSRIGIILGDVSGKGVPAALYMVRILSEYRSLALYYKTPAQLLTRLNKVLASESTYGMFATLFYAIVNRKENILEYSSGGHHPLLWRRQDNPAPDFLPDINSLPLGLTLATEYSENKIEVRPGDVGILYSDGVTEARSQTHEEYGTARLRQFLNRNLESAQEYSDQLLAELRSFSRAANQHDDMSFLVFKI